MSRWPKRTTLERFYAKVLCDVETHCWEWQGSALDGYGSFNLGAGVSRKPQNASYRLFVGVPPDDWDVHHICRNTRCVNPAHLVAVPTEEHIADLTVGSVAYRNKRKTHCPKGHPLSGDNLEGYELSIGARKCVICKRRHMRESHARHRDERNARRRKVKESA